MLQHVQPNQHFDGGLHSHQGGSDDSSTPWFSRPAAKRCCKHVPHATTIAGARALVHSLDYRGVEEVKSLQDLHRQLTATLPND